MRTRLIRSLMIAALFTTTAGLAAVPAKIVIEGSVTHIDSKSIEIDGTKYTPSPAVAAELASKVHVGERVHVEISPTAQGAVVQSIQHLNH